MLGSIHLSSADVRAGSFFVHFSEPQFSRLSITCPLYGCTFFYLYTLYELCRIALIRILETYDSRTLHLKSR